MRGTYVFSLCWLYDLHAEGEVFQIITDQISRFNNIFCEDLF